MYSHRCLFVYKTKFCVGADQIENIADVVKSVRIGYESVLDKTTRFTMGTYNGYTKTFFSIQLAPVNVLITMIMSGMSLMVHRFFINGFELLNYKFYDTIIDTRFMTREERNMSIYFYYKIMQMFAKFITLNKNKFIDDNDKLKSFEDIMNQKFIIQDIPTPLQVLCGLLTLEGAKAYV